MIMPSNNQGKGKEAGKDSAKPSDLATVYGEQRSALMRFASRFFRGRPHEVEDVVQEAFIKAFEAQKERKISLVEPYLYRSVKNLAINTLNKSSYRLTDSLGDLLPETVLLESPTLEAEFESRQKFEKFCRAVRQLPVKCQRVFVLRRVYGFSQQEIAERCDISLKTVEAHLTKALQRCTDYMDAEESMNVDATKDNASRNGG
ncbi:sigma-70 family RNA polymerase sigma factor [Maricurvus nonylphenolicus]|uniref:RNA polymerase sigma factor n=1 Tax=Maricurvus nonylphenolicus TaxID=1008307 RepID=UPI0036F3FD69